MKERLEEINNLLERYYSTEDSFEQTDLAIEIIQGHVNWLINRFEESARERAEWEIEARTQYAINKRLKKEIKQYRRALREIRNTDTTKEVYRLWAEKALKGEYRK